LITGQQVIFILGNREHRRIGEWEGLGRIGEHTKNNKIQSLPLTRGGLEDVWKVLNR
jgi:hypothetical protein